MILQRPNALMRQRRSAFTLLEVLVVVAIILILASVATVAVVNVMSESKPDIARIGCQNLDNALKIYIVKNGERDVTAGTDISILLPYVDGDESKLLDPWGNKYMIKTAEGPTGATIYYVYTNAPDGTEIRSGMRQTKN